jgi:acyl-CoA thioester hydrolase
MESVNPREISLIEHTIQIRVRYQETDAQGRVHHANYLSYFELGRVELLRANGFSYREFEEAGMMLVVTEAELKYFQGAKYDDLLSLTTKVSKAKGVRIEHVYDLTCENQPIATGRTVIACVDRSGKVCRLPSWLRGA